MPNKNGLVCFSQEYKLLFEGAGSNPGDKTLEDRFFEHEVSKNMTERRQGRATVMFSAGLKGIYNAKLT